MNASFTPLRARPSALAFALACVFSSSTFAADAGSELRPVVVTGTVVPRTLGSEFAATSVITREDLERSGVRDVVAALSQLGTAQVDQQGGPGTLAAVRLRGADSRDTLVLVDGVPLTDVTSGLASLSQIPTDAIERIEVVRGNLSALYGANATGGVVQIFTRRAAGGFDAQASIGAGNRGTRAGSASVALGTQALRGRLTLGAERTDGFSAADTRVAPTANPDDDGNRREDATLALDSTIAEGHDLAAQMFYVHGKVDYDDPSSFATPTDTHLSKTIQRGLTFSGRHRLAPEWTLGWRAGGNDEERRNETVTSFGPSDFGNTLHTRQLALDLTGAPLAGVTLQLGAERLRQSTDNDTYVDDKRTTDTVRAGAAYDTGWGGLQFNLRRDHTSDFGDATTALLGARWKIDAAWSLFATASSSFTPPTLDFLYFDCSPFGFACSNPDLEPERARNADLALQWEQGAALVRATLFSARYKNKIVNDANFVPQNVDRARNRGLELAARTRLGDWRVDGEATFQNPVNDDTDERLIRRAKRQFALRAGYDAGVLSADGALRYIGERLDNGGVTLSSYTVFDANARWRFTPGWMLQATVENLFDRDYQPTAGYRGRPRTLLVSLGWQMR
ncbi:TonB-dependent receptor plug domain-containing protein [Caldimonas sp. KR1-144]|uniref:TonB-dependent receptor plug domain-containing protein n=1 Tax=Caldimonas sp. KR1-144 TaxID=3400911 RepID=UPI003BFB966A